MSESSSTVISSLQNETVKSTVKLRDARARRKTGRFLIDGMAEILRAAASGIAFETIFVEAESPLPSELQGTAIRVQRVSRPVLEKLSYGERGAETIAVAWSPDLALQRLAVHPTSLVLVLDRLEKPGNLGACLRTAAACGADAVVLTNPVCEVFNPNTIRASRGAVFTIPIAIANTAEFIDYAALKRLSLYAARVDGQRGLWDCDFRSGSAVVFGNEANGLGPDWQRADVQSFQIPMSAGTDSLNVSISTAVTLYEAVRQRRG